MRVLKRGGGNESTNSFLFCDFLFRPLKKVRRGKKKKGRIEAPRTAVSRVRKKRTGEEGVDSLSNNEFFSALLKKTKGGEGKLREWSPQI